MDGGKEGGTEEGVCTHVKKVLLEFFLSVPRRPDVSSPSAYATSALSDETLGTPLGRYDMVR